MLFFVVFAIITLFVLDRFYGTSKVCVMENNSIKVFYGKKEPI
jgi:hypothetical protein